MGCLAAPLLSAESTYRSIAAGFGSPTAVAGIVCTAEGTEVMGFGFPSVAEKVGATEGPGQIEIVNKLVQYFMKGTYQCSYLSLHTSPLV